jgi:uncharacterized RDD family membrane protein YckC
MLQVKLDTGFNIEVEFAISPFHKRLLAWIIDLMTCWLYIKLISLIVRTPSFFVWTDTWDLKGLLVSLPVLFYHLICEVSFNGRSVGKMAMNIKVITEEGGQPTLGQYLIRWVFRLIDFPYWIPVAIIFGQLPWWTLPITVAGLISIIFTQKSQRLGDLVAGTILIDLKNSTSWQDTVFTEIESSYQPSYPQVMHLSDRDINTLKSIIQSIKRNNDHQLSIKIADRIKSKLKIDSDQDSFIFLQTLLKDYNYYSTTN